MPVEIPSQMSGVYLTRHGGLDALEWRTDIPVPQPAPGQVLVRVRAAGVNNTDINTRTGWYSKSVTGATDGDSGDDVDSGGYAGALNFPLIQGGDLCGEVVALGDDVAGIALGARVICGINQPRPTPENPVAFEVIGSEYDGAFAQYCCTPADQLYDVSASPLSDAELGAMPCAFGTAMALLDRASVSAGDTVLITGASGGVGLAAVQLAALRGARVLAQTSADKAEAVRGAGASETLGRGETPGDQSITVAIDLVGGAAWGTLIDALKPGGRYATSGAIAGPIVEADLRTIYLNDLTIFGVTYQPAESFSRLVDLINHGKVRPLVSKTYPLKEIAAAQGEFAAKHYPGKLVLLPEYGVTQGDLTMPLTQFAKDLIAQFPLGFVATVTPNGRPAVSPKGTFLVLDDRTIAFGEIRSPGTLANLAHMPEVEVNFIDQWKRKGVRIRGGARMVEQGAEFDTLIEKWRTVWGDLAGRINVLVVISADEVKPVTTPPYDDGATEEEMIALYKSKFAEIYP